MGSDQDVMDRHDVMDRVPYAHPLALGLSLNYPYSPFKDAQNKTQKHQDHLNSQRYIECVSYLSYHGNFGALEPAFINKRNERERQRVRCVNQGYARLRQHLPQDFEDKRLSKVETLRAAIGYIKHLQDLLDLREGH